MSKGIAIRTILYLLVGIIVIGVIIYLVYSYTTGPVLDMQTCRSRLINWCTTCELSDWSDIGSKDADSDIGQCITNYFGGGGCAPPVNCNNACGTDGDTEIFCEQFLG